VRWAGAGALGAALLGGAGAYAQVPADPNNPNEAVPDKATYTPYGETIRLEDAKKVAAAALDEATKRGWPMCISIVGPSGDLIYFEKMDDCQFASVSISQHKARTGRRYRGRPGFSDRLVGKEQFSSYLGSPDDVICRAGATRSSWLARSSAPLESQAVLAPRTIRSRKQAR